MIELVLVVCLAGSPASCREERPGYEGLSMTSCLSQGQLLAAQWLAVHPDLMLTRWRCEPSEGRQERI